MKTLEALRSMNEAALNANSYVKNLEKTLNKLLPNTFKDRRVIKSITTDTNYEFGGNTAEAKQEVKNTLNEIKKSKLTDWIEVDYLSTDLFTAFEFADTVSVGVNMSTMTVEKVFNFDGDEVK